MAQLNRFNGNVAPFGSNATSGERWVFGSQGATVSDNIDDNLNSSFLQGWEAGLDVDGFPTSQDFNAQQYTTSLLVSYLFQTGIAEWNNSQEYYTNSIAVGSNGNIYQSLTDNNIGNDPTTDAVNWISFASKYTLDINGLTEKVTPVDNDILVIEDSADSFNKKKIKISSIVGGELPSVTGTFTATNATNNINLVGIGALDNLEIGDVIQITNSVSNNSEYTVEVITDNNNIIVNQAHAGANSSKSLVNETNTSNVTVKILAKWYNAPKGLGQGRANVGASRAISTVYTNNTGRTIELAIRVLTQIGAGFYLNINGNRTLDWSSGSSADRGHFTVSILDGETYELVVESGTTTLENWYEIR